MQDNFDKNAEGLENGKRKQSRIVSLEEVRKRRQENEEEEAVWRQTIDSRKEMVQKVYDFDEICQNYLYDKITDAELLEHVTQPVWHSLYLLKQRLDKKDILLKKEVTDVDDKGRNHAIDILKYETGENRDTGEFRRHKIVDKKYIHVNRLVYEKKEKEICRTCVTKVKGDGEYAVCPKCGHKGKITGFSNGCNYCRSKFKQSYFQEKVSFYSPEPDEKKKISGICKRATAISWTIGLLLLTISLIFMTTIVTVKFNPDVKILSVMRFVFYVLFDVKWEICIGALALLVVFILMDYFISKFYMHSRIVYNDTYFKILMKYKDFSLEDFVQNLEYKLKAIHFAEKAREVEYFTIFEMDMPVQEYRDVIDCSIHKLKFISWNQYLDQYIMNVEITLRLVKFKNEKIRTENEKVCITLSRDVKVKPKNIREVSSFTCHRCGGVVDVMNGGACGTCMRYANYSKFDWMITGYYSNLPKDSMDDVVEYVSFGDKKYMEEYKKKLLILLSGYIAVAILMVGFMCWKGRTYIYINANGRKYVEIAQQEYDSATKLSDFLIYDAKQIAETNDGLERTEAYWFDSRIYSEVDILRLYYALFVKMSGYNRVHYDDSMAIMSKKIVFDKYLEGYIIAKVTCIDSYDIVQVEYKIYKDEETYLKSVGMERENK